MKPEMNAEYDPDLGAPVQDVAQEAIDAVATTYTNDAGIDVDQQLRAQLSSRGIRAVDESWLSEVAHDIRSGHHVRVGQPDVSVKGA
jgi:hypothetical protein